jgi:hypothetical protein
VGWASRTYRWVESQLSGARPKPTITIGPRREFDWVYLRVESGTAHEVPLEELSGDELLALPTKYPGAVFIRVGWVHEVHRTGLWFPWLERWLVRVTPEYTFERGREVDFVTLRATLDAAALKLAPRSQRIASAVRRNGDTGRRILWSRIAMNAAALALAGLVLHAVVTHRHWRAQRRWRRDGCPKCSYALAGTPSVDDSRTCPECGVTAPVPVALVQHQPSPAPAPSSPSSR